MFLLAALLTFQLERISDGVYAAIRTATQSRGDERGIRSGVPGGVPLRRRDAA